MTIQDKRKSQQKTGRKVVSLHNKKTKCSRGRRTLCPLEENDHVSPLSVAMAEHGGQSEPTSSRKTQKLIYSIERFGSSAMAPLVAAMLVHSTAY